MKLTKNIVLVTNYRFKMAIIFFAVWFYSPTLVADFITLIKADQCTNIVEMFIQEKSIRITFELGEPDYKWFKYIIPANYYEDGFTEQNSKKSFHNFFTKGFKVKADGVILIGDVKKIEKKKRKLMSSLYTGKVDSTRANEYVIFVEIEYKLNHKPKRVTFIPPFEEGFDVSFANIGFVTYHKKIPVNDIRYLGTSESLNLNWEDPWYSYFDNRNLRRHHKSSLMSFLYIEPYEVRHEVLVRVKDLETWLPLNYGIDDYIEVDEQDSLKNLIANFLVNRNIVNIDGKKVKPIIDKVYFVEVRLFGIQILQEVKKLDYSSAIIGVIFAYPDPGMPGEVTVNWDLFNDDITQVPATATDPAGPMKYILQPDDDILMWRNYLKKYKLPTISEIKVTEASLSLPLISLMMIGVIIFFLFRFGYKITVWSKQLKKSGVILLILAFICIPLTLKLEIPFLKKESFSKPDSEILISELLKNTYRSIDFRNESDVYDKLAISNHGDLLAEIYLQTKRGMVLENQGGISVKVSEVSVMEVEEVDSDKSGLAYKCTWQVKGSVGHWGHIHQRTNQYQAVLNVEPVDGVWKFYNIDIIEETRI
jgi:hypothetical protein